MTFRGRTVDPRCTCDNEQGCVVHDPAPVAAATAEWRKRRLPGPEDKILVAIDYTNYKGERRKRRVIPLEIEFRETPDHKPAQWILQAYDVEKGARRSFAMKDIHSWEVVP